MALPEHEIAAPETAEIRLYLDGRPQRALLTKPDWLFLDEATAALDEPTEEEVYRIIREKLPNTTVVSIGHRSTLTAYHDRRIDMKKTEGGLSTPVDMRQAEPAE